jgi:hypothetical protein
MTAHVDRMKIERKELQERVDNLNTFIHDNEIFKTLDAYEQARMIKQAGFMESYLFTLTARLWAAQPD